MKTNNKLVANSSIVASGKQTNIWRPIEPAISAIWSVVLLPALFAIPHPLRVSMAVWMTPVSKSAVQSSVYNDARESPLVQRRHAKDILFQEFSLMIYSSAIALMVLFIRDSAALVIDCDSSQR